MVRRKLPIRRTQKTPRPAGVPLRRSEGTREGRWVVLDYGHILIHLFHRDERAYYHLDRLWNDGTNQLELPFDQTVSD